MIMAVLPAALRRLLYSLAELICLRTRLLNPPGRRPAPQICRELTMAAHRIDTHHHPYPPVYIEKTGDVLKHTTHAFYDRLTKWQPSQAIEAMDKDGIAVSVLSVVDAERVARRRRRVARRSRASVNEAAAKMQQDHKGRFGHFAALPLPDVEGSLREIEYAFDTLKADGIALTTNYVDKYPGDEAFAPVFDELNRRKAVVYFHPTAASFAFNVIPEHPAADHRISVRHHARDRQPAVRRHVPPLPQHQMDLLARRRRARR